MQNRREYVFFKSLERHLDDRSKLRLSTTSRFFRAAARCCQPPYTTQYQFVMAFSGDFTMNVTAALTGSWKLYKTTLQSNSLKPAMLYKFSEAGLPGFEAIQDKFEEGEDLDGTGRRYWPIGAHFWEQNKIWTLAQIHKKRPFTILTEVTEKKLMSKKKPHSYSAFAKEITLAIKAGYTITVTADNYLSLQPTAHSSDFVAESLADTDIQASLMSLTF